MEYKKAGENQLIYLVPADRVVSKCRQRCDLCIHYSGSTIGDEFRKELYERLTRVYSTDDWSMRCPGCYNKPKEDLCEQLKCAKNKGIGRCLDCKDR